MPVTHEPWLVALSLFLAIQGSYVGLSLAADLRITQVVNGNKGVHVMLDKKYLKR